MSEYPRYEDLPIDPSRPPGSAWGVFGDDDEVGTLNFITDADVQAASASVVEGAVFPLNWSIDWPSPPLFERKLHRHSVTTDAGGGTDDSFDSFYPQASSQWDALCHIQHPKYGYYNGVPADETPGFGGKRLDISKWARRGIAGRFVLVDVARHRERIGTPLDCSQTTRVTVAELDDALEAQGVALKPGDILLLHFGWTRWHEQADLELRTEMGKSDQFSSPGLACLEETAAWLWDHRVAAVAGDNPAVEATPFTTGVEDAFLHYRLIPLLGMAIGEMLDLADLAAHCAEVGRYEGLLTAAPLNVTAGAGSTANTVALM